MEQMLASIDVIQFVDQLFQNAVQQATSDIHIETYDRHCRIRYRQDGLLHQVAEIQNHLATRVIARLKVMASLDIAEKRLPQDGRFQIQIKPHKTIDVRISICPVLHGEKIVCRLLDNSSMALALGTLGFTTAQQSLFLEKIARPQGLILVTGPTGSGKTVTLYSALHYLNNVEKNILTVEDPVEIQLDGINQAPINLKAGLDFATTLRAFLRQDPDIIMVGEIRDKETANIAIQAAQTGHLVFSTLHTNNTVETLVRLISMGSNPYHLVNALSLIIAQRLVRKLCPQCKQIERIPKSILNKMGFQTHLTHQFYCAHGCSHCTQGYKGRTGIFECLPISQEIAASMMNNDDTYTLLRVARQSGFSTLADSGFNLAIRGETSIAELNRVLAL